MVSDFEGNLNIETNPYAFGYDSMIDSKRYAEIQRSNSKKADNTPPKQRNNKKRGNSPFDKLKTFLGRRKSPPRDNNKIITILPDTPEKTRNDSGLNPMSSTLKSNENRMMKNN